METLIFMGKLGIALGAACFVLGIVKFVLHFTNSRYREGSGVGWLILGALCLLSSLYLNHIISEFKSTVSCNSSHEYAAVQEINIKEGPDVRDTFVV